MRTIGFIGCGNMGGAIVGGISDKGLFERICVYDKNADAVKSVCEKYGAEGVSFSEVSEADVIVLAVKPNVLYGVLSELAPLVNKNASVISIVAGQSVEKIEKALPENMKIMRVMPNTPALVGEGMSALSPNSVLEKDSKAVAEIMEIFGSIGKAEIVPESLMNAVTGVSGSSPAYVFMFIEALADSAVKAGMPRDKSYIFASQAVLGSAKMVLETGIHPAKLKDMVCSPGGTTIEAVEVLEKKGFRSAVIEAVDACVKKSESM